MIANIFLDSRTLYYSKKDFGEIKLGFYNTRIISGIYSPTLLVNQRQNPKKYKTQQSAD